LFPSAPVSIAGTLISQAHLFNMLVAAIVGALLYVFFRFTKPGIAMRAITEDPVAAQLMGIPVRRIVMLTWAVGGVLAAISGVLLAPRLCQHADDGHGSREGRRSGIRRPAALPGPSWLAHHRVAENLAGIWGDTR
jgi:branched-subunit amino acid ABC-type transport system permease component